MAGHTRVTYLSPNRLLALKQDIQYPYCYTPICYICGRYLLYQIAIIRGGVRNRRKYTCILCAYKIYPAWYVKSLITNHYKELKDTHRRQTTKPYFRNLLRMLK